MCAKIILVSPPAYGNELPMVNPFPPPPLGLCVLKNELCRYDHEVMILDSAVIPFDFLSFKKIVSEFKPDIVGITTYYQNLNIVFLLELIKSISKNIITVLGGVIATKFGELILKMDDKNLIDFVLTGAGIKELVAIASGNIDNKELFVKINKGYINVEKTNRQLPCNKLYLPNISPVLYKRFHYVFNSGCPFNCSFCVCAKQSTCDDFNIDAIINEINLLNSIYGYKNFVLLDETLTLNKDKLLYLSNGIQNKDITFWGSTRSDCIDEKTIEILKNLNFNKLFIGIESTKPETQKYISYKAQKIDDVKHKINLLHNAGILAETSLLIGLPFETKEDFENSLMKTMELGFDYIMFTFLHIVPGTEIYNNYQRYGYKFIRKPTTLYELFNEENYRVDGKGYVISDYLSVDSCDILLKETTSKLGYEDRYGKPMGYIKNNLSIFPY